MPLTGSPYSSVSWTVGDVLTEAKLDAMVANDRAYDSHAPNGSLLDNNIGYFIKDTGGTNREVLNLTSSDIVVFGSSAYPFQLRGKNDGWNPVGDSWAYASATAITVPSGAATYYAVGDKIKITQTTVKYFSVVGVADTLLTVTGGSDYAVANASITDIYVSRDPSPVGFPGYFNYTPAETGWSSMTVQKGEFSIHGRDVFATIYMSGTSDSTSATAGLPVNAPTRTNYRHDGANGYIANNGSDVTTASKWYIASGGSVVNFYTNMTNGAWANANEKTIVADIHYRI